MQHIFERTPIQSLAAGIVMIGLLTPAVLFVRADGDQSTDQIDVQDPKAVATAYLRALLAGETDAAMALGDWCSHAVSPKRIDEIRHTVGLDALELESIRVQHQIKKCLAVSRKFNISGTSAAEGDYSRLLLQLTYNNVFNEWRVADIYTSSDEGLVERLEQLDELGAEIVLGPSGTDFIYATGADSAAGDDNSTAGGNRGEVTKGDSSVPLEPITAEALAELARKYDRASEQAARLAATRRNAIASLVTKAGGVDAMDGAGGDIVAPVPSGDLAAADVLIRRAALAGEAIKCSKCHVGFDADKGVIDDASRAHLRDQVSRAFDARQELQEAELNALRQRLTRIDQQITARQSNRDTIIDRRVEELLNPHLRWEESASDESLATGRPSTLLWLEYGLKARSVAQSSLTTHKFLRGAVVVQDFLSDDSPFKKAGLRPGDLIYGLDKWEITSAKDMEFVLGRPEIYPEHGGPPKSTKVYFLRGEKSLTADLHLDPKSQVAGGTQSPQKSSNESVDSQTSSRPAPDSAGEGAVDIDDSSTASGTSDTPGGEVGEDTGDQTGDAEPKGANDELAEKFLWEQFGVKLRSIRPQDQGSASGPARTMPGSPPTEGVEIVELSPKSPFQKAGMQIGDMIFRVEKWRMTSRVAIAYVLSRPELRTRADDPFAEDPLRKVSLQFMRDDARFTAHLTWDVSTDPPENLSFPEPTQ